jgi:hypothetical protein
MRSMIITVGLPAAFADGLQTAPFHTVRQAVAPAIEPLLV